MDKYYKTRETVYLPARALSSFIRSDTLASGVGCLAFLIWVPFISLFWS